MADATRVTCPDCGGNGWYPDHAWGCWGNCSKHGCPVQTGCSRCRGTGQVATLSTPEGNTDD